MTYKMVGVVCVRVWFNMVVLTGKTVHRTPGESWMVHGPTEYFPPIEVGTPEKR